MRLTRSWSTSCLLSSRRVMSRSRANPRPGIFGNSRRTASGERGGSAWSKAWRQVTLRHAGAGENPRAWGDQSHLLLRHAESGSMSGWDTGISRIFENDIARDVFGEYRFWLEEELSDNEASRKVIEHYADRDHPFVWLGLAVAQWHFGRLDPEVKRRALRVIDEDTASVSLAGDPVIDGKILSALRVQLERPQRRRREVKPKWAYVTDLAVGDVLASPPNESGRVILRVVSVTNPELTRSRSRTPIFEVYRWASSEPPSLASVATLEPERPNNSPRPWLVHMNNSRRRLPDWRDAGFALLGRLPLANPPRPPHLVTSYLWESAAPQIQKALQRPQP